MLNMRFVLVAALMTFAISSGVVAQQSSDYKDADAFAVYSAFFKDMKVTTGLLVRSETKDLEKQHCLLEAQPGMEDAVNPVIKSYREENKFPRSLTGKLDEDLKYEVISPAVYDETSSPEDWDRFHLSRPNSRGMWELSAVGFNPERTKAVVYAGYWCGPVCGNGDYYLFEKKQEKWSRMSARVSKCSWVS